jgi:release factor glutamine methyltransferase
MTKMERPENSTLFAREKARLEEAWAGLPDKPEETPETTLRALWCLAHGEALSAERAREHPLPSLDEPQEKALKRLVDRRLAGEPLGHLTRRQCFMGLELYAGPQALIPRKETELLGREALLLAQAMVEEGDLRVLDLCTGCGNLALALAHGLPRAQVLGADLSEEAVALARENARFLGLEDRVHFVVGDLLQPIRDAAEEPFDLILCNPPYISTARVDEMAEEIRAFEPKLAFDGGRFGVGILWKLLKEAPDFLKPGGALAFEIGLGQAKGVLGRLSKNPAYRDAKGFKDAAGQVRALVAWKV